MFLETFSAVYRSTLSGFERNLCLFTAIGANSVIHLPLPEAASFFTHSFHLAQFRVKLGDSAKANTKKSYLTPPIPLKLTPEAQHSREL